MHAPVDSNLTIYLYLILIYYNNLLGDCGITLAKIIYDNTPISVKIKTNLTPVEFSP